MKVISLLESGTDKTEILKLQQELLELLPDDVNTFIEPHPYQGTRRSLWRLRCEVDGFEDSVIVNIGADVTEQFCHYIVARLLKGKLKSLEFVYKKLGRYFLTRPDGREYSGILRQADWPSDGKPPFKIVARHSEAVGKRIFAVVAVYSTAGLDRALAYLDGFNLDSDTGDLRANTHVDIKFE